MKKTIFIFLSFIIMVFIVKYFEIENNFVNIICGLCIGLLSRRIKLSIKIKMVFSMFSKISEKVKSRCTYFF